MNLLKLQRPFYKVHEGDLIITKPITRELLDNNNIQDTILDPRLEHQHGFIKLKSNMLLYNYFVAKKSDKTLIMKGVNPYYVKRRTKTYKVEKDDYLRIPKGINKIFKLENGLRIMTGIQKAYNNIIIENNTIRKQEENIIYQNIYTDLLVEFNTLLSGKGALYDRACNSLWPYSCRATITNNPNLNINEVSIPYKVLMSWVSTEEVRNAFNIDLNLPSREAVKYLENKRVLVGRQPTHDRSNIMSFVIKLKFNNGYSIKVNPAVVHLFDGDFDGDQAYVILPLTNKSQSDLVNMDVYNFIRSNPEHFRPGKEFKKFKPEKWATENLDKLNRQIADICKMYTNGQSLSYHDCLNDGRSDGYLDALGIDHEELVRITQGIYEDNLIKEDDQFGISGAVRSYKLIKQNVAQFGALSNAFLALAIHHTWNIPQNEKLKYLDLVAQFKHILCQDGLSAKHGNNRLNAITGKILQDMFYRTPENKLENLHEYKTILESINLPEKISDTILNLFWKDPIVGINKILNNIVPTFRITRRGTDISLLENMTEQNNEKSIQSIMLF